MADKPENLISEYIDGQLTADQRAQFESLLNEDAELREMTSQLMKQSSELSSLPRYSLGSDFADRVMGDERVAAAFAGLKSPDVEPQRPDDAPPLPRQRLRLLVIAITSLAAMILIGSFLIIPPDAKDRTTVAAKAEAKQAEPAAGQEEAAVEETLKSEASDDPAASNRYADDGSIESAPAAAAFQTTEKATATRTSPLSKMAEAGGSKQMRLPEPRSRTSANSTRPQADTAREVLSDSIERSDRAGFGTSRQRSERANVIEVTFNESSQAIDLFKQSLQRSRIPLIEAPQQLAQSAERGGTTTQEQNVVPRGIQTVQRLGASNAFLVEATPQQMSALIFDLKRNAKVTPTSGPQMQSLTLKLNELKTEQNQLQGLDAGVQAGDDANLVDPDKMAVANANARAIQLSAPTGDAFSNLQPTTTTQTEVDSAASAQRTEKYLFVLQNGLETGDRDAAQPSDESVDDSDN